MAVPRTFRLYIFTAVILILLPILYLFYTQSPYLPLKASSLNFGHAHPQLLAAQDIGLVFPNDPVPRRDFSQLSAYPAHNINEERKFAFATFYCTRQPDTRGPYFEATQSIIWRLLWSDYRSKYPIIVFVCPFIPAKNRRIFEGQGAIVKEVELLDDIIPDELISTKRWIDVLSKLNVWKEVEWEKLVFLDSDAFPVRNNDDMFDLVPVERCKVDQLSDEDKAIVGNGLGGDEMCNYIYAGVAQFTSVNINAGMLILKPNLDMHAKLLRAARKTDDYTPSDMEQGVLRSKNAFAEDGPFPVKTLPPTWNALPEYYTRWLAEGLEATDGPIRILHTKMWNRQWGQGTNLTHLNDMWDLDWMKMCRFYDDDAFVEMRKTGIYKTPLEIFAEKQQSE